MDDVDDAVAAITRLDVVPRLLEVVCRTTGMRFAAVARVTPERWIACQVRDEMGFGLAAGGELQVETTICHEIMGHRKPVAIDHVAAHPVFCVHPTPARYGFQSYISVPLHRVDGTFFGTLCAIDPQPARVDTPATIGMFELFAELVGLHLDAQDRLAQSTAALLDARQAAELRDQFIAVLGHDLRNPLASIDSGVRLLQRAALDATARSVTTLMQASVKRMVGLLDDLADFARGRLGGGLVIERDTDAPLAPVLWQVVAELRTAWSDRAIEAEIALADPVPCDRTRIAQLLSHLATNALRYGAADEPVRIVAATTPDAFTLSVANAGQPIAPAVMRRMFQPFFRTDARSGRQGLGLGMYIAAEIARAHGGTLDAASSDAETRMTFTMPIH